MPRTLLISGSLAVKRVRRWLTSAEAADLVVVEFDTSHAKSLYPRVLDWVDVAQFATDETAPKIEKEALDLLDLFLEERATSPSVPTSRTFRQSCMRVQARQIVMPYLFNLHVGLDMAKKFDIQRIVVGAGSGVNFAAWRQLAREIQVPCEFLPEETLPGSLKRRFSKWLYRIRRRKAEKAAAVKMQATGGTESDPSSSLFVASERLQKLLKQELSKQPERSLSFRDAPAFPEPDQEELAAKKAAYQTWWKLWQENVFGDKKSDSGSAIHRYRDILLSVGEYFVGEIYPRQAHRLEEAHRLLRDAKPEVVFCDTQTDTAERMWALAARESGIPVAAYTYDHLIDPRFSFTPDFLLSDSGRNTKAAVDRGMDPARIVETISHRRPRSQPRSAPASSAEPPLILFADSYYSGMNILPDPQASCRYYQQLVAAAERLPHLQFKLKFHPLRGKKNETFSFTTMDDRELLVRTSYLKSLNPPANFSIIAPEENIQKYLNQAAILLNSNSIVALEAFHIGVPVIFIRAPDPAKLIFPCIDQYQAALCALNVGDLVETIQRLISDGDLAACQCRNQRTYIDDYYWRNGTPLLQAIPQLPPIQAWMSNKSVA